MRHKYIARGIVICMAVIVILLIVILATPVKAYEGGRITTARQDALHEAAEILRAAGISDDAPTIKALSEAWWREQEDLDIIAKVIQHEADPEWCEWEHSVAVGVVVVNRERSPYFPDTIREVVSAPGQYLPSYCWGFEKTSRLSYLAAKDAFDGNHNVPDNAYWQDNHIQGVYVWKSFVCDTGWFRSTTYICCGIPGVA